MNVHVEHFAEQMMSGLTEECWRTILQLDKAGRNSLFVYDRLLTPSMRHIGMLWEQSAVTVADEHLASGVCDILLTRYADMKRSQHRTGSTAMFLCVEGETHYLGLKMVAALFQEYGWNTKFLGPSLPIEYAVSSAQKWRPDVIALSASMSYLLPQLGEYVSMLEQIQHKPTILVGSMLSESHAEHFRFLGPVHVCDNLLVVTRWLKQREHASRDTMLRR